MGQKAVCIAMVGTAQCRRTFYQVPIRMTIHDPSEIPNYQKIAEKALKLNELGLNCSTIARQLEVDHKTVSKAINWIKASSDR